MKFKVTRGGNIVTVVTTTEDDATFTPFTGHDDLAKALAGKFKVRTSVVSEGSRMGVIKTLPLCSESADSASVKLDELGYGVIETA